MYPMFCVFLLPVTLSHHYICCSIKTFYPYQTHTHTRLTALFPGQPRWAGTRKVKPIWTLLKQETVSGSGISWDICKSAPHSRQITTPAPHRSVFYRPDALPVAQPTASKHWRQILCLNFILTTLTPNYNLYNMLQMDHTTPPAMVASTKRKVFDHCR